MSLESYWKLHPGVDRTWNQSIPKRTLNRNMETVWNCRIFYRIYSRIFLLQHHYWGSLIFFPKRGNTRTKENTTKTCQRYLPVLLLTEVDKDRMIFCASTISESYWTVPLDWQEMNACEIGCKHNMTTFFTIYSYHSCFRLFWSIIDIETLGIFVSKLTLTTPETIDLKPGRWNSTRSCLACTGNGHHTWQYELLRRCLT